jgi:CHAD domain-containing protein
MAQHPGGAVCGALPTRVQLRAEGHHGNILREVCGLLQDGLGLTAAETSPLAEALAACEREPGGPGKPIERLDPAQRADAALKQVLLSLLGTLEAQVEGARRHLDSEFLHQLRVATRRTRSALGQVKGVLPSHQVDEFKARFAWLQQVTGPVRDLDVYLLGFDDYRDALPTRLQSAAMPIRGFLSERLALEQPRLEAVLRSAPFETLLADWRAFLEAPVAERPSESNAAGPIKTLVSARILRMAKRVRNEGRAIQPSSPATALHELRKSCKKLRYLMELFQSLYPPRKLERLLRLVKSLLDHLGLVQDLAVQAEHLLAWADEMRARGEIPTDTLLAMGALVGQLLERQQRARDEVAAVFDRYLHDDHQALFRELFGPT